MPDGKVLAVGGNLRGFSADIPSGAGPEEPVFEAEIFDPATGTWTLQPPSDSTQPRWYHSVAMLLPDGRVLSAGGQLRPTGQFFNPPYITAGVPRHIITSAPAYMPYDAQYSIGFQNMGGKDPTRACLIRLASVTHGFDHDQRRVPLTITSAFGDSPMVVKSPENANLAPPGYYMLFILNEYGYNSFAPCQMAAYVRLGP